MRRSRRYWLLFATLAVASGCRFDKSERWQTITSDQVCTTGARRCGNGVEECVMRGDVTTWTQVESCAAKNLVCEPVAAKCQMCRPGSEICQAEGVAKCKPDGTGYEVVESCDSSRGIVCRDGICQNLCGIASKTLSNVGCEYWGVDLDNAMIDATSNAAAQQYAIVISNPQPDVSTLITITQDDGLPGDDAAPVVVASETILPKSLQVFKLGPREVDGSPDGEFDTGTGTALTRHAYKVVSTFPVVAFQFNPLDNVNVFSNDASLLKPVSALGTETSMGHGDPSLSYVVVGWPQTIARSTDANTNFGLDLRAFVTVVGTRPETKVRVQPTTRVIPGGPVAETQPGGMIEVTLGPHDVLNLESGGFNADFTGTKVMANAPVVVFSGSEASDSPTFEKLADRFCCADHLEHQLDPLRTAGTEFVGAHGPSRTKAVKAAGAPVSVISEPDFFRIVAASEGMTEITTTLPAPDDHFFLIGQGDYKTLRAYADFTLLSTSPVMMGNVSPSQDATGIARGYPGGDPSLVIIPPAEQWRTDYVFLTPDKYSFDFVTVIAPPGVPVLLDAIPLDDTLCDIAPGDGLDAATRGTPDPPYLVYRCQLSFPIVLTTVPSPDNVLPGMQNDGVHRVTAQGSTVGVLVSGFDSYVSYGYAAGTQLSEIHTH